VATTHTEDGHK